LIVGTTVGRFHKLVICAGVLGILVVGSTRVPASAEEAGGTIGRKAVQGPMSARSGDARTTPLVGVTWGSNVTWSTRGGELVRVDPDYFRPLPGPRLELGMHGYSWSYSPDRSRLVLGGFGFGLRFVDLERFEHVGDLRERRRGGLIVAVSWPTPRRVLAVVQERWGAGELTLAVVDPVTRTLLEWRPLSVSAGAVRAAGSRLGLALLLSSERVPRRDSLGPARLLFIDARGVARSVVLGRIPAGERTVRRGSSRPVLRFVQPGLTLDRAGRRAFVVGGGAPVAEIDLSTMRVSYHEPSEPISLFGRLRNWLEPAAQAKGETEGPTREVRWLDHGQLAVSGFDARGEKRSMARGLKLIDTRTWVVRTLDRGAADFVAPPRLLLAYGCCHRTGDASLGLTAYDESGRTLWHRFGRTSVHVVQAGDRRAYVRLEATWRGRRPPWVAVVDLRGGKVLRKVQTPWLQLLPPDESSMAEKEG
jgi:hypothetical protein